MRLIDADRIKRLVHEYMGDYSNAPTRMTVCKTILSMLGDKTQVPTIDPIHAAGGCYCQECAKFSRYTKNNLTFGICKRHNSEVGENDFCSYGERKDGDQDDNQ